MSYKILIATRSFGSTSTKPWDILNEAGCELVRADMTQKMTEERLIELLQGVDGAIIGVIPMTAQVLANAPSLKVVSMHGVGVEHIDLSAAVQYGVVIASCPGANEQSVADLAMGLMIAIARNIPSVERKLRQGGWGAHTGYELWKKTLGLIGFGRIGHCVARRALGFDMRVLAYDPHINPDDVKENVSLVSFEEVLHQADYVSLHAALNNETHHMIALTQLEMMKPSAYLINTSRGLLVDEGALYIALSQKKIAGAALDVFCEEPPVNSPLLQLDNVVLTPHIGAHTCESIERAGVMAAENVLNVLRGVKPHYRVV